MTSPITPHVDHDDFGGRARDVAMDRRRLLRLFAGAGAGAAVLAACGGSESSTPTTAAAADTTTDNTTAASTAGSTTGPTTTAAGATTTAAATDTTAVDVACESPIAAETAGPFPGDGSNGPDVLGMDGVVRQDIRTSIGGASGTAAGVELTMTYQVLDTANGCAPYAGAAIYAWHCTADGNYSMYSESVADENFLRGVQVADADGLVTFTTVYPGCYPGRWPHVHFEVYPTVDDAIAASNVVKTSQLAFPQDTSAEAYTAAGYEASAPNLAPLSLESDGVFADGWLDQLAVMSGDVASGYTSTLVVRV
jgi:protocatechuate 3,4-dioxygenase beta subunit